ncbi:hypothetical protein [Streptomyces sp. NPDC050704]|uniref:hypothetical protein n=1 Tax=Streptomyces sp. NPDC050704 TaxID=3157219 RepID=UPI003412CFBD
MLPGQEGKSGQDGDRGDIDDIDDAGQLLRYALVAQLARLKQDRGVTENTVALAAGMKGPALSKIIRTLGSPTKHQNDTEGALLRRLDSSIVALAADTASLGGLNSLGIRLRGLTKQDSLIAHTPANWTWEMLEEEADTEFAVLMQASALLSLLIPEGQAGPRRTATSLKEKYKKGKTKLLISRLALIGGAPPTSRNIDALVLLGALTKWAYDGELVLLIEKDLRDSPLGFRLWRAVTKLVHLCGDTAPNSELRRWVTDLLENCEQLRGRSSYPGRSLDLELAIAIPHRWSSHDDPDGDWVRALLLARAEDTTATLRERGTAALGLWQRTLTNNPRHRDDAVEGERVQEVEARLRELVTQFRHPEARKDAAAGMRWVAMTLESVLDAKVPVCNQWPEPDAAEDPWFQVVQDAANSLDSRGIPAQILRPTKVLFLHVLLQNAGVQRRQAIDTLLAGGWARPVIKALAQVLRNERTESWLRIRVLFAIGYLQCRDSSVATILTKACKDAHLKLQGDPTRAQITEMHAVLFAIGDCFGAGFGARDLNQLTSVREEIAPILAELVDSDRLKTDERFLPVARALVYLLTFIAQNRRGEAKDLSEQLLLSLREHPDKLTRDYCEWVLRFRFSEDGTVQSLLHAADE